MPVSGWNRRRVLDPSVELTITRGPAAKAILIIMKLRKISSFVESFVVKSIGSELFVAKVTKA